MRTILAALFVTLVLLASPAHCADRHMVLHGGGLYSATGFGRFAEWACQGNRKVYVFTWGGLAEPESKTFQILRWRILSVCPENALEVIHAPTPAEVQRQQRKFVGVIEQASGVFFAGGDQTKVMESLDAIPALRDAIVTGYQRGSLVFGGDSAGAAMVTETMIASSVNTRKIELNAVTLTTGLGLLKQFAVDQHFSQRPERHNRVHAIALSKELPIITVDETTAAAITNEKELQVFGNNYVSVINSLGKRRLNINYLVHGDVYDLQTHTLKE